MPTSTVIPRFVIFFVYRRVGRGRGRGGKGEKKGGKGRVFFSFLSLKVEQSVLVTLIANIFQLREATIRDINRYSAEEYL